LERKDNGFLYNSKIYCIFYFFTLPKTKVNNDIRKFERIMVGKTAEQCYEIFNDFGIASDIRIVSIAGNPIEITEKYNKDSINVEVDNIFDKVITKVIGIG
jgi:hypothetical protein